MNALMDNREQMLNPTAFIQSTFNTVGAQLALLLKYMLIMLRMYTVV